MESYFTGRMLEGIKGESSDAYFFLIGIHNVNMGCNSGGREGENVLRYKVRNVHGLMSSVKLEMQGFIYHLYLRRAGKTRFNFYTE